MLEHEYLDLAEPRTRFELRSEIYEQQRATSPAGAWILRNGDLERRSADELESALRGAAGSMYRIVRRIALGDPALSVRFAEGAEHRLEFLDESGEILCWIVVDVAGEPVLWGRSDVEWVFGPLVRFGNIRVPGWGAYTNGEWRYEVIDARASSAPLEVSFDPPAAGEDLP